MTEDKNASIVRSIRDFEKNFIKFQLKKLLNEFLNEKKNQGFFTTNNRHHSLPVWNIFQRPA